MWQGPEALGGGRGGGGSKSEEVPLCSFGVRLRVKGVNPSFVSLSSFVSEWRARPGSGLLPFPLHPRESGSLLKGQNCPGDFLHNDRPVETAQVKTAHGQF